METVYDVLLNFFWQVEDRRGEEGGGGGGGGDGAVTSEQPPNQQEVVNLTCLQFLDFFKMAFSPRLRIGQISKKGEGKQRERRRL